MKMSLMASYETLFQATVQGQADLVQSILEANKYLLRDEKWTDYNLLILALQRDQKSVATALLRMGCRVNQIPYDNLHHSPLYYAVALNDILFVNILLENGAFINTKKNGEETALAIAMKHKQYEIVDLILSKYHFNNIDPSSSDDINHFLIACERNQVDIVKSFISGGISVNSYATSVQARCLGYTPLHYAVKNLNTVLVDFFLSKGADFLVKDGNGWTPLQLASQIRENVLQTKVHSIGPIDAIIDKLLFCQCEAIRSVQDESIALSHFHIACTRDNPHIVNTFLQNGVEVNGCIPFNQSGLGSFTALHYAAHNNCYQVTELLLNNGANVNAITRENWTPLMFAVTFGFTDTVELLLARGADVSIRSSQGLTAIHYAFNSKRRIDALIDLLLSYAPKLINPTTPWGLSHFHIACARGNLSVIEAFIENKVDINAKVDFKSSKYPGYSPLHFAIEFTRLHVVDVLIKNRATLNLKDMRGMTPLHLACLQNYRTLIVMLNEQIMRISEEAIRIWRHSCDDVVRIVELLLFYNADVNIKDDVKATPLYYAFGTEKLKDSIIMMTAGGYAAIEKSIMIPLNTSQEKIAEMIIKEGADVNSLQMKARTPLHNACIFTSACKCLLKADCQINALDSDGNSPLFLACRAQNLFAIRELLRFGADMSIVNSSNQSIFCILHRDDRYNHPVFRVLRIHYKKMLALGVNFQTCFEESYLNCCKRYDRRCQQDFLDSDSDSDYEDSEDSFFDNEAEAIFRKCKFELQIMKTVRISNFSTLYDIMYKNAVDMAKISKNEDFIKFLLSNELDMRFPQYRDFLLLQFRRGTVRDSLIAPASQSLTFLSRVAFPEACVDQIFRNLDNSSLRNLIKSVHTVEAKKRKSRILVDDSEPTFKHLRIRDQ
ncbi:hypothetical protein TSAR_005042 [Trichomalopsis sarcophagae]|uniref:Uncharacterized protein n=1 Tax=Trichomalopsis sarcophagae TaxID=543379 RepID=A0A232F7J4_9HYME|nr:hypothetical protein TSAR_005042 [Trichomalopsis sarcophagae]